MNERVIVGVAVVLSVLALTVGRMTWQRELSMGFTAADVTQLECEGDGCLVDGLKVRPFVSTARQLVFVKGVFESERVAQWIATNPQPTAHVVVHCEVEALGERELRVRFATRDQFAAQRGPLYRAIDCTPF